MGIAIIKNNKVSVFNKNLSSKQMVHWVVMSTLAFALFLSMMHGCWAEAKDLLAPGDETVKATFGQDSSLMTWLLIGEVVMAILGYVATRNFKILGGIIVLSVFINVAFAIIGK